jgi:cyclic pyranopterin phosphate synthase
MACIKTCLYDDGVMNLKDVMRLGADDNQLRLELLQAFGSRVVDGWQPKKPFRQRPLFMSRWRRLGDEH